MRFTYFSIVLGLVFVTACGGSDADTVATTADSATTDDTSTTSDTNTSTDTMTSTDTTPATDSMVTSDVPTDSPMDSPMTTCTMAADAGAMCNTLTNTAVDVVLAPTGMAIPTGTGGTIVSGRYTLTAFKSYTGSLLPAGQTLRQTLEVCGEVAQYVGNDKGKPEIHKTFTIKPTGTAPNINAVCSSPMPDVAIPYASYTATSTQITFYSTMYNFSATYTKS